jgi:hypothetical protein
MQILSVQAAGDSYFITVGSELVTLTTVSGAPLPLLPGWTPVIVLTGLAPVSIMELHHAGGDSSIWFLDEKFRFQTNNFAELPPDIQDTMRRGLAGPARAAWTQLVATSGPGLTEDVRLVFRAGGQLMREMTGELQQHAGLPEMVMVRLDHADERPLIGTAGAGPGAAPISGSIVAGLFSRDYLKDMIAAVANGQVRMPSPATGAMLSTDVSYPLNPSTVAYRFHDPVGNFTFYALATRWRITLTALYFPASGLVICANGRMRVDLIGLMGGHVQDIMFQHVVRHASDMDAYVREPARRITTLYQQEHIGHHLYNELGGMSTLLQHIPAGAIPDMMLMNAFKSEMFGPVDAIFPEFQGKIDRTPHSPESLARHVYRRRLCVVRPTDDYVSRDLTKRIIGVLESDPALQVHRDRHQDLVQRGFSTVLLGLRVENRTVIDQAEFFCEAIDVLVERLGRVACVVDGHDAAITPEGAKPFLSHGEGVAKRSVIDVENEILEFIRERYRGRPEVEVISAVGISMSATVFWCNRSMMFITPWGAGLAKYRWLCNRPGLIAAGYRFLDDADYFNLHLYDMREYMEDPTPVVFFAKEDVEDDASATQLIDLSDGYRVNYRVRPGVVRHRVLQTLATLFGIA